MKRIGILYHPQRNDSSDLAQELRRILRHREAEVWHGPADDEEGLRQASYDLDLLITLGGDGTIVRAVRIVAEQGLPVLGVNLGRLGFLAEMEPADIQAAIPAVLDGRYHVEERMMLRTELKRGDQTLLCSDAINDVVLARGKVARTVRISVDVDDHYVMTLTADGVIVSTPTGSTAYCLAAGGPIVAPDLHGLVLTPIAAHLAMAHSIVVPAHRCLRLRLIKGDGAMLTVDGELNMDVQPDDEVYNKASENTAKFVRFGSDGYFYETILRRLRWPDQGPIP